MRQVHLHHSCEGEDRSLEVCQGQWVLGIDCLEQKFIKSEARPWPGGHERRSTYSTATTLRSAARRRSSQFLIPNSQICSPGHEGPLSSHHGFHKYIAGHFWARIGFKENDSRRSLACCSHSSLCQVFIAPIYDMMMLDDTIHIFMLC